MSVAAVLKGHDIFKALPVEQVDRISQVSAMRSLGKGETVYMFDGLASHTFVLIEGRVALKLPAGTGQAPAVVARVGKGELFGLAPLLGGKRYTTTAECVEPCKVFFVEAAPLLKVLKQYPDVGFQVMSALASAYLHRYEETVKHFQGALSQIA